jgi:cytoskeletal protein CcmA (bactofilin family)
MSVNCRHCHRRVIIENLTIKAYHAVVRLATAGALEVTRKGAVVGHVRVTDLLVEGSVKGNVTALGRVAIGKKGSIEGDVHCRSLLVEQGARLKGFVRVDPQFTPAPSTTPED